MSKELISYALSIGAIELVPEGRKLKSGRISPYFFNSGLFRTGRSISFLASAYAGAISSFNFNMLFGPAYKGIPLVTAVAMALDSRFHRNTAYCYNRKEEKNHGEGGTLIGESMQGRTVFIIDDVITEGSTAKESIEIVRNNGGTIAGYAIAFDRQERGTGEEGLSAVQEIHRDYGIPIVAAARLKELIEVLTHDGIQRSAILEKIVQYRDQYGCK